MNKETYYFRHDYNARNDMKIASLIKRFSPAGYGVYWMVAEMLHESADSCIPYNAAYLMMMADSMNIDETLLTNIIKHCITIGLFEEMKGYLVSARVVRNKEEREKISDGRRKAGKKGAIGRWGQGSEQTADSNTIANDGKGMANSSNTMANDGKEKERKEKETPSKSSSLSAAPPMAVVVEGESVKPGLETLKQQALADPAFTENIAFKHMPAAELCAWLTAFNQWLSLTGDTTHKPKRYRAHFTRWLAKGSVNTQSPQHYNPLRTQPGQPPPLSSSYMKNAKSMRQCDNAIVNATMRQCDNAVM